MRIDGVLKGTGSLTANLITNTFSGVIDIGQSFSCITFAGIFVNDGVLSIEVNGLTPCTDFDRLEVTGTATLGGSLSLSLTYDNPAEMETFTFLQATKISGRFTSTSTLPKDWHVLYNYLATGQVSFVYSTTLQVDLISFTAELNDAGANNLFGRRARRAITLGFILRKVKIPKSGMC